jgi:hypothetical protein
MNKVMRMPTEQSNTSLDADSLLGVETETLRRKGSIRNLGLLDGHWWTSRNRPDKLTLISGIADVSTLATALCSDCEPSDLEMHRNQLISECLIQEIDQLYDNPTNLGIPIISLWAYAVKQAQGQIQAEREEYLSILQMDCLRTSV